MKEREFLLFRLSGPMSSFGEIAVGQRRSIWAEPSKSAVFGFLAACLGIKRIENQRIINLEAAFGFAVRIDDYGKPLRDFHTAMAPSEASRKKHEKVNGEILTRKSDLDCDDLSTMLSERLYRTQGNYIIAIWVNMPAETSLEDIAQAIKMPKFAPFLGRKSCPIGLPANPVILSASGLNDVFTRFDSFDAQIIKEMKNFVLQKYTRSEKTDPRKHIFFDIGFGLDEDDTADLIRKRRDSVRNRDLWHFENREEGRIEFQSRIFGVEP